jgi:hypothetical protein
VGDRGDGDARELKLVDGLRRAVSSSADLAWMFDHRYSLFLLCMFGVKVLYSCDT